MIHNTDYSGRNKRMAYETSKWKATLTMCVLCHTKYLTESFYYIHPFSIVHTHTHTYITQLYVCWCCLIKLNGNKEMEMMSCYTQCALCYTRKILYGKNHIVLVYYRILISSPFFVSSRLFFVSIELCFRVWVMLRTPYVDSMNGMVYVCIGAFVSIIFWLYLSPSLFLAVSLHCLRNFFVQFRTLYTLFFLDCTSNMNVK